MKNDELIKGLKILLVEDDPNLGFVIMDHLEEKGSQIDLAKDGAMGLDVFKLKEFDLCILDVMLPKMDGFTLAQKIREINEKVPIIFLTAKAMDSDKIQGFLSGGDDYMTKPFNMDELILRMISIFKRIRTGYSTKTVFNIGKFEFDYNSHSLKSDENEIKLTGKEADLLKLLITHKNEVLNRSEALKMIWGNDDYFLGRSMDVYITKLRKHLKEDSSLQIENIHGVGFKLIVN